MTLEMQVDIQDQLGKEVKYLMKLNYLQDPFQTGYVQSVLHSDVNHLLLLPTQNIRLTYMGTWAGEGGLPAL